MDRTAAKGFAALSPLRKRHGVGRMVRSYLADAARIPLKSGEARLVCHVITSAAEDATDEDAKEHRRRDALDFLFRPSRSDPWFSLLDVDAEPVRDRLRRLLPLLGLPETDEPCRKKTA